MEANGTDNTIPLLHSITESSVIIQKEVVEKEIKDVDNTSLMIPDGIKPRSSDPLNPSDQTSNEPETVLQDFETKMESFKQFALL